MLNKQDFFGFKNIFAIPICQDGKRMVMKWSQIALSFGGLTFLNVKGDIPICSPELSFKRLSVSL